MGHDTIIIACENCHAKNRIPVSRIGESPRCGKCGTPLPMTTLGRVLTVTDASFDRDVMGSGLPVLLDFWAPWCGHCQAMAPVLDGLAGKYAGRVRIAKLNLDENPATGSRFAVTSVPPLILVKNGQVRQTLLGAVPVEQVEAAIGNLI